LQLDNPIDNQNDDSLGRSGAAQNFASHLLAIDPSVGFVVGVLGKWGSGKTSFLNLMRPELHNAGATTVDFNPWLFSGAEQLAEAFFIELAAQLKPKREFADITQALEDYGESLSELARLPIVGGFLGAGFGVAKTINRVIQKRRGGVQPLRAKIRNALAALDAPIFVIVDDVDRLSNTEIRDIFKLVRLTASFPNLVYVMAFDRERVELALTEGEASGREYLEKIIQLSVDVPFVPSSILQNETFRAIDAELTGCIDESHFSQRDWPNVYFEIIKPLIKNMRDVKRFTGSLKWILGSLDGKVEVVDVLALEAIRTFLPEVYYRLPILTDVLTSTSIRTAEAKDLLEGLIASRPDHSGVIQSLAKRVFPATDRHLGGMHYGAEYEMIWLRRRRVASSDILRFYLEHAASDALTAFGDAEQAWAVLSDQASLEALLERVAPEAREALIQSLEAYESDFRDEHLVPAATVLLNAIPSIPDRPRGFLEFDADMTVGRVVYRLLRAHGGADLLDRVREIISGVERLTQQIQLINMVGDREGVGHNLLEPGDVRQLEAEWRERLRAASSSELSLESDLTRVFYEEIHQIGEEGERTEIPDDAEVTRAILRSAKGETKVQSGDNPVIERRPRLAWDILLKLYGEEKVVRARVDALGII